jgi:ribosome biogenesis GTPase
LSRGDALDLARVIAGHGRHYVIETPDGVRLHAHSRGKKSEAVVGDRVRYQPTAPNEGVIEHIEPRRNLLKRQDDWRSKSFAANLDQLLVLVAGDPMYSESQLARALVAANDADIPAVVVLNKTDLDAAATARERLAALRAADVEVLQLSMKTRGDEAVAVLQPRLQGRATLVLGPSGAGKSTLINRLAPDAKAQVGEISRALNSGRHTTTTTQWYWLDALRESALIDSPGFQEFGLQHIEPVHLAGLMPDLGRHVADCRFVNCTHREEPGCGVRAAVERGDTAPSRHRVYLEIYDELANRRMY